MNDLINISALRFQLALNLDIIKNGILAEKTVPHIFLILVFGWKKTEYLALVDF